MLKLFARFYFFIVIALISLSALLDNVLFNDNQEEEFLKLLAISLTQVQSQQQLQQLQQESHYQITLLPAQSISFPIAENSFEQSKYLLTYNEEGDAFIYTRFDNAQILQTILPAPERSGSGFFWYSLLFFTLLALLTALWLWPVWRDIKTLQGSANSLKQDGSIAAVSVPKGSSLRVIADALQQLSGKVQRLLNNQRELTGAVAHEFRTPMARLKFSMESIEPSQNKQSMLEDVTELENLIQEMLEFSQSEHHTPELAIAEIPVHDLTQQVIASITAHRQDSIKIHNNCENQLLIADGHFVERALLNLVNNGLKYAQHQIIVTTHKTKQQIQIIVDDDGPGIPDTLKEKVFDAFYRPDKSRARHKGGAGLGLATVKKIMSWHGGHCWVEDSGYGGAKFILEFPLT